jgi:predicted ATPase
MMMLTRWGIWNFKSVGSGVTIDFRKITLLVGANSSGKSSIVQTLLLLKQTFQYGQAGNTILLNGPLVRLGNFDDVSNALNRQRSFSILFDLNVDEETLRQLANRPRSSGLFSSAPTPQLRRVEIAFKVGVPSKTKDELQLQQPVLRYSVVSVSYATGDARVSTEIEIRSARPAKGERTSSTTRRRKGRQITPFRAYRMTRDLKDEMDEGRPKLAEHGALSRFFLPDSLLVSYDARLKAAAEVAEFLGAPYSWLSSVPSIPDDSFFKAARDVVIDWLDSETDPEGVIDNASGAEDLRTLSEAIEPVIRPMHPQRTRPAGLRGLFFRASPSPTQIERLQELRSRLYDTMASQGGSRVGFDVVRPKILSAVSQNLEDYFRYGVRYLGPIRDAPKPLYPLEPLSDPTDVGYSGEHTAAVYDLNKAQPVQYVRPPHEGAVSNAVFHRASLHEAAVDWLAYMGVISGIATSDRGKFGRELQVQTQGLPKYHDLTNVGVGVSQVLPIVVMSLLAGAGSLLIFEQPELHLHPKVQARLGDFFIAMTALGKQCLVETHSEYLLYRLRRRIAEDQEDATDDLVGLYFVERLDGETKVRPVHINAFGALAEWPKDFFDQTQGEAEKIIRAAARKHKLMRDGKSDRTAQG